MRPGPKPKPTQLRVLEGNPSRRRLPKNEPQPTGTPEPPTWLTAKALEEWNNIVPGLSALGIATNLDANFLAVYCDTLTIYRRATGELKRLLSQGQFLTDEGPAALESKIRLLADQLRKQSGELGMTPSSRSKIEVNPGAEPQDELHRKGLLWKG